MKQMPDFPRNTMIEAVNEPCPWCIPVCFCFVCMSVFVRLCSCVCAYVSVFLCDCVSMCLCVCMDLCVRACACVRVCLRLCLAVRARSRACVFVRVRGSAHACARMCFSMCVYLFVHIWINTYNKNALRCTVSCTIGAHFSILHIRNRPIDISLPISSSLAHVVVAALHVRIVNANRLKAARQTLDFNIVKYKSPL